MPAPTCPHAHTILIAKDEHEEFMIDAETEAAILYNFATHPELRDAVKTKFSRIQSLFAEYQRDLQKAYPQPEVPEPK